MALRITRDDLYREIWNEPATKVANRHDVSSSYLARVCEALNVPRPPRGYWARRAVGEKISVPALPPAGPGDPVSWAKGVALLERLPPLELPASPKSGTKAGRPRRTHHPLVTAWRTLVEEAPLSEGGYMMPRKKNVLDAFVTKTMIRGAADALNSIFIELEMRGMPVRLAVDYGHRPPVEVTQAPIRDPYGRRPNDWHPNRPTVAHVGGAVIGLTLFELTEHVRVRRKGADRYVRISDLPAVRRYAPQAPDEEDLKRDMPTGRFVLRAYSVRSDIDWQHEWTEMQTGEFAGMATAIADYLKETEPVLLKEMEAADQRARERRAVYEEEVRQRKARERAEALQRARQAAKEELRSIVKAWNDAFALEAFFSELSRRADALSGEAREALSGRIQTARDLMGGQDAVARFLRWTLPSDAPNAPDRDGDGDEDADEVEFEDP